MQLAFSIILKVKLIAKTFRYRLGGSRLTCSVDKSKRALGHLGLNSQEVILDFSQISFRN